MVDDQGTISAAAGGDRDAQAQLMAVYLAYGAAGTLPRIEALAYAETFAALAAAQSGSPEDALMLGTILELKADYHQEQGDEARAAAYRADAEDCFEQVLVAGQSEALLILIGVLSVAADDGSELAAIRLNRLMEKIPADVADGLHSNVGKTMRELNEAAALVLGGKE